jgi:membrane fusion protein (multidrug efflux system)
MNEAITSSNDAGSSDAKSQEGGMPASKMSGKKPLVILAVAALVIAIVVIVYYLITDNQETTDDSQVDGNAVTMQAKVAGYVIELDVTDNERVLAGHLLFRIDPRDYIAARDQARASVAIALAQQENASANLDMIRVSAPAKLDQAKAQIASATSSLDYAASELNRQTSVEPRSTTRQTIDQAKQNLQTARANLENNQAEVRIANLIPQNLAQAKSQLDQAVAQVAQARAQLATAELNLGYTEIRAPQEGWVTQRNIQVGSYVAAGQSAFSLVSPAVWITANFKENQLDRMRIGQPVKIKIDAYPGLHLEGHVDSLQIGTGSRFSAFPSENATGNFIKIVQRVPVKILLDRGLDPKFPMPLGLSARPTVDLK